MQFLTLEEAKTYLRVDSTDEDSLISALLTSSEILCCEVARISEDEWAAVCAEKRDRENDCHFGIGTKPCAYACGDTVCPGLPL